MKIIIPVIVILLIAGVWYFLGSDSGIEVVRKTVMDPVDGTLEYGGIKYTVSWGETRVYSGDVRHIGRAKYKYAPVFTHDALVTTGDFSDPSKIKFSRVRNGKASYRFKEKPNGTVKMLHIIPENETVLEKLNTIKKGDKAEFMGREEDDHIIEGSDGRWYQVNPEHDHIMFLLADVSRLY
jgi:hypothetical protein